MNIFKKLLGRTDNSTDKSADSNSDIGKEGVEADKEKTAASERPSDHIIMGIMDVFPLVNNNPNLVVVGMVHGTVHVGDAVYLTNCGEDEDGIFLTTILGIETSPSVSAREASDCHVGLLLENGGSYNVKKGTVIFSRDCSSADVHNTYISTLGDVFVMKQNLEISDKDLEQLSIADCAEIWRLFTWFQSKAVKNADNENEKLNNERLNKEKLNKEKLDRLGAALCKKILSAKEIYCVYSKATGEPYMFSNTVDRGDGTYMCTPPYIAIATKQYEKLVMSTLSEDKYEFKRIENGEKRDGIYNFLGSTFYLNGACNVGVLSGQTIIAGEMLVPKPDYSNIPPQNIPVTNPDLVRWMLLMGQLGKPEGKDGELIYKLYYRFMSIEMTKANLLIPMQNEGDIPAPDENGKTVLKKDVKLKFPTMEGKYGRPAIYMFTDWKRLRMVYGEDWNGMVQPVSGMIEVYDCAVNATQFPQAGCYVSREMFEEMKKFSERQ